MFDPTAYENMKVVIEGTAYDLDLEGQIKVVDRKDIVDLATLTRKYEITFCLKQSSAILAKLTLEAKLNQLAAEILQKGDPKHIGAFVNISFTWNDTGKKYIDRIKEHWGPEHNYEERKIYSSLNGVKEEIIINFSRLITEDMIDDLVEMFHYSVQTLKKSINLSRM
ncbi:hypothetical protein AN964_11680 [Heyndrickxia shackletonii]|uniref:Uncharacterized protein n=1 Tax=Heyndrickxia shackletonii TaxID=157838 RepID=A0A0Q3TKI1_9BACI|nr:hypothetical protein [Heyndrickxia shackletonii]KQL54089.1 hypothetical protein AN964_11680 [Heyndrickxia shackletonii]NEY99358.1 hypothetical protein [Heyndrickxia shackletonii]